MLTGGVTGLSGKQEDHGMGDFFGGGHAAGKRNFGFDAGSSRLRIGEFQEPRLIERSHDFGGNHGVDADLVGEKFDRPLAGKAEYGGFGSDVAGGAALAGDRSFGADVDDGAAGLLEGRES